MSDIINNGLIGTAFDWATGQSPFGDPVLKYYLFVNDTAVTCDTEDSDLTRCTAPGYMDETLTPTSWDSSITDCVLSATYATFDFAFTGPGSPGQTIYGYALYSDTYSAIWWAQRLTTPYPLPDGDSVIEVTLALTIQQCPESPMAAASLAPRVTTALRGRRRKRGGA